MPLCGPDKPALFADGLNPASVHSCLLISSFLPYFFFVFFSLMFFLISFLSFSFALIQSVILIFFLLL